MKLSAPIHVLKIKAKDLKKAKAITMTEALNEVARSEGYSSWSLLQSKAKDLLPKTQDEILNYLNPGDLMIIGSRPGHGKTSFALKILLQASKAKKKCYFFSLEYTHKDVASKIAELDVTIGQNNQFLKFDFSDQISSQFIIEKTKDDVSENSVIVVDYLQLLDQQRSKPEIQNQTEEIKTYAKEKKCIIVFVSQIDRTFEINGKERPGIEDIRIPNPLDLALFNKIMFIHNGETYFTKPVNFDFG